VLYGSIMQWQRHAICPQDSFGWQSADQCNGKDMPSVRRTALGGKVLTNAMAKIDAICSKNSFGSQSADQCSGKDRCHLFEEQLCKAKC
ncbi:MAG: hypothetical protein PHY44_08960, partial [Lachnospiraceae bacterium]|nr:hypothetical protein [Lachnospiraceae bacterium]